MFIVSNGFVPCFFGYFKNLFLWLLFESKQTSLALPNNVSFDSSGFLDNPADRLTFLRKKLASSPSPYLGKLSTEYVFLAIQLVFSHTLMDMPVSLPFEEFLFGIGRPHKSNSAPPLLFFNFMPSLKEMDNLEFRPLVRTVHPFQYATEMVLLHFCSTPLDYNIYSALCAFTPSVEPLKSSSTDISPQQPDVESKFAEEITVFTLDNHFERLRIPYPHLDFSLPPSSKLFVYSAQQVFAPYYNTIQFPIHRLYNFELGMFTPSQLVLALSPIPFSSLKPDSSSESGFESVSIIEDTQD